MKKLFALTLALLLVLSLCACGGGNKGGASSGSNAGGDAEAFTPVSGTAYDTGMFTVTVPTGWLAVAVSDFDGGTDPAAVTLVKDGAEDWDALDHAYIRINLYGKDELIPTKEWYDNTKDLPAMSASGFDFTAFSGDSSGYPYIILEGSGGNNDISISLLTKNDVNSLDLNDADVQTIIRSISVK